jgi:hypothetical protein
MHNTDLIRYVCITTQCIYSQTGYSTKLDTYDTGMVVYKDMDTQLENKSDSHEPSI